MNFGIQPDVHNVADMFVLAEIMMVATMMMMMVMVVVVMKMKMIMVMVMMMMVMVVVVMMMMKMMKTFLRKFSPKSGEWRSFNAIRLQTATR